MPAMERILTVKEVCAELRISYTTLHRLRQKGALKPANENVYLARPRELQFTRAEIDRFKREREAAHALQEP